MGALVGFWHWASHLTFLALSLTVSKMGIMIPPKWIVSENWVREHSVKAFSRVPGVDLSFDCKFKEFLLTISVSFY